MVYSAQVAPDPRESDEVGARRQATDCGCILVVLPRLKDKTLGTMTAINRLDQPDFDTDDVEIMVLFADYCAIVTENTRLFLEHRRTEQALMRQNAMKDKLFTILAHDLRGPIGNTYVLVDLISGQVRDSAYQTDNLTENLLGWIHGQIGEVEALHQRISILPCLVNVQAWPNPQAKATAKSFSQALMPTPRILRS